MLAHTLVCLNLTSIKIDAAKHIAFFEDCPDPSEKNRLDLNWCYAHTYAMSSRKLLYKLITMYITQIFEKFLHTDIINHLQA